ncbi:MAG: hypothetical protein KGZ39_08540 [Simkania sp.]|nr:hypothetical protein [Simkania sp.]
MKYHLWGIIGLLSLVSCQSKGKDEEERGADFEKMVIIQEDRMGQDIGGESEEIPKMR